MIVNFWTNLRLDHTSVVDSVMGDRGSVDNGG